MLPLCAAPPQASAQFLLDNHVAGNELAITPSLLSRGGVGGRPGGTSEKTLLPVASRCWFETNQWYCCSSTGFRLYRRSKL